jgi:hypothetical protein
MMKLLCIYKQPPSIFASLSKQLLHNYQHGIFKENRLIKNPSSFSSCCIVHALKDDSKPYEVDPEKAKEALKELDQKIQSVSTKQVSSPKLWGTFSYFHPQILPSIYTNGFCKYSHSKFKPLYKY